MDLTDAALLLGGGLLCLGVCSLLAAIAPKTETPADPYHDHPTKVRELTDDLDLPDPHTE